MCVVSMVGDHFTDKWKREWPQYPNPYPGFGTPNPQVTREEFERLRRELEEVKSLLIRAKEYDIRTNQPDCEIEAKVAIIKKVAEGLGVDLAEVFSHE